MRKKAEPVHLRDAYVANPETPRPPAAS
jgi:hypothetical protein